MGFLLGRGRYTFGAGNTFAPSVPYDGICSTLSSIYVHGHSALRLGFTVG